MGFRNTLARFGAAAARMLGMNKVADRVLDTVATSANPSKYPRMAWVSKPVHKVPDELVPFLGEYIVDQGKGSTMVFGANRIKRHADAAGTNNKQRRRLRASLKRRHRELIAQAVASA